jgi:hypothetical protein
MTSALTRPVIASFWFGSDLSWLESLCIKSFLDRGHAFVLYTAEPITGVPDGTDLRDAADILWPPPFDISDNDRLRVAVFSDIFRIKMMQKTGYIWVDLDAYCVQPFDFASPYLFVRTERDTYPTGVLGFPQDSETLRAMMAFLTSPNPVQPWRGPRLKRRARQRIARGESWGIEALPWECSGPRALAHFLRQSGEADHAMAYDTFYPLRPEELWKLHAPFVLTEDIERPGVHSVHIYGHQKKIMALGMAGLPRPDSYLARLCDRHQIDPAKQPIPVLGWMQKAPTTP